MQTSPDFFPTLPPFGVAVWDCFNLTQSESRACVRIVRHAGSSSTAASLTCHAACQRHHVAEVHDVQLAQTDFDSQFLLAFVVCAESMSMLWLWEGCRTLQEVTADLLPSALSAYVAERPAEPAKFKNKNRAVGWQQPQCKVSASATMRASISSRSSKCARWTCCQADRCMRTKLLQRTEET